MKARTVVLIILDGWGVAPPWGGNAIALSKTPHLNKYSSGDSATTLAASGEAVGLPPDDPGNSEVGHLTIGSGRIVKQDLPKINEAIISGAFFRNPQLIEACRHAKEKKTNLHLIGLVSSGGVHSHIDHLFALLELIKAQGIRKTFIHFITDGRDTSPYSAVVFLDRLQKKINELKVGSISSVMGRFFAMDRDHRWMRTQAAYQALTEGKGRMAPTAQTAIAQAYQESYSDEFIPPTLVVEKDNKPNTIGPNDAVIFFNFRADRARQLTRAFSLPDFLFFPRKRIPLFVVTMTEYERGLPVHIAFPPQEVQQCLAAVVSDHGLSQLHIAETEKYAHVTYFINGLREKPFPGEARLLVPSQKVATYDQIPEMSTLEITRSAIDNLKKKQYSLFVINFANGDMVGHTGNLKATIKACEVVDQALGKIVTQAVEVGADIVITADHGNAEELLNPKTGDVDTAHNINPVPFIILSAHPDSQQPLRSGGGLRDVAPTILKLMGLPAPSQMTGTPLFAPAIERVH